MLPKRAGPGGLDLGLQLADFSQRLGSLFLVGPVSLAVGEKAAVLTKVKKRPPQFVTIERLA
jgi:hypothetical protein